MTKELEIRVRRMCQVCGGTGTPEDQPSLKCAACMGTRYAERWLSVDEFMRIYQDGLEKAAAESKKRRAEAEAAIAKVKARTAVAG